MLSQGKEDAYLEVEHHITERFRTKLSDRAILRSAVSFVEKEIRAPRIVAYEGYLREGFEECHVILCEELSKMNVTYHSSEKDEF